MSSLSTWEVRSTQITGQGIRSFDDSRDMLWARATLTAVSAFTRKYFTNTSIRLYTKSSRGAGIHEKQPQTDRIEIVPCSYVYLGHPRRTQGPKASRH